MSHDSRATKRASNRRLRHHTVLRRARSKPGPPFPRRGLLTLAAAPSGVPVAGAPAPASASQPGPADRSPALAFATDDLEVAGPASPEDVVRARQFARMASAQVHSLLESIERELGRLGATPARTTPTTPTTPTTAAPLPAPANPSDEGRRRRSDVEY